MPKSFFLRLPIAIKTGVFAAILLGVWVVLLPSALRTWGAHALRTDLYSSISAGALSCKDKARIAKAIEELRRLYLERGDTYFVEGVLRHYPRFECQWDLDAARASYHRAIKLCPLDIAARAHLLDVSRQRLGAASSVVDQYRQVSQLGLRDVRASEMIAASGLSIWTLLSLDEKRHLITALATYADTKSHAQRVEKALASAGLPPVVFDLVVAERKRIRRLKRQVALLPLASKVAYAAYLIDLPN